MATRRSDLGNINTFFESLTESDWQLFQSAGSNNGAEAAAARETHKLALHGLLMFYLNRRTTFDYKRLMEEIAHLTQNLLR